MRKKKIHHRHHRLGFSAVALLALVSLLAAYATPVSANTGAKQSTLASLMGSPASNMMSPGIIRIADAGDDVTLSYDITGRYDRQELLRSVAEFQQPNTRLSDVIRTQMQAYRVNVPYSGVNVWEPFGGSLSATDSGLQLVIKDVGEARANAGVWYNILATATGVLVGLGTRAVCLGTLLLTNPGAAYTVAVICAAIGGFLGGMTRSLILMGADGKLADAKEWGKALINSLVIAFGAALWEAGINIWSREELPGLMSNFGDWVKSTAAKLPGWLSGIRQGLVTAGEKIREMAGYVRGLIRPPANANLRIMPLGDSVTAGARSNSGNGYRGPLFAQLEPLPGNLDLVGGQQGGPMADSDHEGHSGWRIDQIAAVATDSLMEYRPNVVALLAGTNDLGQNYDVPGAPARLAALVDQILASDAGIQVLVATIPFSTDGAMQTKITAYNNDIVNLLGQRERVEIVDTGNINATDMADPLHPNDNGYEKLGRRFADGVFSLLVTDSVRDPLPLDPRDSNLTSCVGMTLYPQGTIATGVDLTSYTDVHLADLNGDGRDDYLSVLDNGAVEAMVNGNGAPNAWVWWDYGRIAGGVGAPGRNVEFADINGDGRDDYLAVDDFGRTELWINGGGKPGDWIWYKQGEIAAGTSKRIRTELGGPGVAFHSLTFADLDGDRRDDYIISDAKSGASEAWLLSGDAFKPTLNGPFIAAWGAGPDWRSPRYANVDCNRRADYLRLDLNTGDGGAFKRVLGWRNNGRSPDGGVNWQEIGEIAGAGAGWEAQDVRFADMDGDGRDDFVPITRKGALVNVYTWK